MIVTTARPDAHIARSNKKLVAGRKKVAALRLRPPRQTTVDPLTSLHNQRWAEEILGRQILRASMAKRALCVMALDIDQLDDFKNAHGSSAGDQAIYTVAHAISANVRPTDLVARVGGDQFIVILPDTDLRAAGIAAEHLRRMVAGARVVIPHEYVLPAVTVSVGVVQLGTALGADQLIADANAALVRAVNAGGNRIAS